MICSNRMSQLLTIAWRWPRLWALWMITGLQGITLVISATPDQIYSLAMLLLHSPVLQTLKSHRRKCSSMEYIAPVMLSKAWLLRIVLVRMLMSSFMISSLLNPWTSQGTAISESSQYKPRKKVVRSLTSVAFLMLFALIPRSPACFALILASFINLIAPISFYPPTSWIRRCVILYGRIHL